MSQTKSNEAERIKILWIDDDPSETIDNEFYDSGIDTTVFQYTEDALREYKKHRGTFQAIVLDLQDADGTVIEFTKAVKEFESYLKKDFTPLFVLTNFHQDDQPYNEARGVIAAFGLKDDIFYHKSLHMEQIVKDIKGTILNSDRFLLYRKYHSAFEAFESEIFDVKYQETLFNIVQKFSDNSTEVGYLFNEMRQIYEMIFFKFIDYKMPEGYDYDQYFSESGKKFSGMGRSKQAVTEFLRGQPIMVQNLETKKAESIRIEGKPKLFRIMADVLQQLSTVLNEKSHYNPETNPSVNLLSEVLPNFAKSTALLLLDLISWSIKELSDPGRYEIEKTSEETEISNEEGEEKEEEIQYKLKPGESRQEFDVKRNDNNPNWPRVRNASEPGIAVTYPRCVNADEFKHWLNMNGQGKISAITRPALEIVRFEI